MAEVIYLVGHGHNNGENLSAAGVIDAERARDQLRAKKLGRDVLLLSSVAERALQTAEIIAQGLNTEVIASPRILAGGNLPRGVESLDSWIEKSAEEVGHSVTSDKELVVVTHLSMLTIAQGLRRDQIRDVPYGKVYEYTPGSWKNSEYDPKSARNLEQYIEGLKQIISIV